MLHLRTEQPVRTCRGEDFTNHPVGGPAKHFYSEKQKSYEGKVRLGETELSLKEIILIFRRRWKIMVTLPALAGIVVGVVSYFVLIPTYEATTTLWVIKKDTDQLTYNDVLMNRNLASSYAVVAKSLSVMEEVIDRLDLEEITPEELQQKLAVSTEKNTEILSFTVKDSDPVLAAKIANAVADVFQQKITTLMDVGNVAVVDRAAVPTAPVKPRPIINIAVAVVLGAIGAVGITIVLESMDTTVKSSEDLTRYTGLPNLAVIPRFDAQIWTQPRRRFRRR